MLSKMRRCLECDYTWSRYLAFPTCPRCGEHVTQAVVRRETTRLRRIVILAIVLGVVTSLLAEVIQLFW